MDAPDRLWKLLCDNKNIELLKESLQSLQDTEVVRAQIHKLWENARVPLAEALKEDDMPEDKLQFCKRILGALQLIAYNFLGNVFGEDMLKDIVEDHLVAILESQKPAAVALQFETMRTCVQLIRSLEEKMEPFVGSILKFCIGSLKNAGGIIVIPSLDFVLLTTTLDCDLVVPYGQALLNSLLQFFTTVGDRPDLILEAGEVLGQLILLALPGSYGDMMKKPHDEEEDDEDEDDDSKAKDDEDEDDDEEEDDEIPAFTVENLDFALVETVTKFLVDWEPKFVKTDESNIDIVIALLCALSGEYSTPEQHQQLAGPILTSVFNRLKLLDTPSKQINLVAFLGKLLRCSKTAVVDRLFDSIYSHLCSIHTAAKLWSKEGTKAALKKRHRVYIKFREENINTFGYLITKGGEHLREIFDKFFSETALLFADPYIYAEFFVSYYGLIKGTDAEQTDPGIVTIKEKHLPTFVKQTLGQFSKEGPSASIKMVMLEALKHLAVEAFDLFQPYLEDFLSILVVALENAPEELCEPVLVTIAEILDASAGHEPTQRFLSPMVTKIAALTVPIPPAQEVDPELVANSLEVLGQIFEKSEFKSLLQSVVPDVVEKILAGLGSRILFDEDVDLALFRLDFLLDFLPSIEDATYRSDVSEKALNVLSAADADLFGDLLNDRLIKLKSFIR